MSDAAVFVMGLVISIMLFGGLGLTVLEVLRLGKEATARKRSN